MKLTYKGIRDPGQLDKERIVFEANTACDVGRHCVFAARKNSSDPRQALAGFIPTAYWFPDQKVNAGDLIVLYTKQGDISEKAIANNAKSYFYYWRQSESVWSKDKMPVLLEIDSYSLLEKLSASDEIPP